MPGQSRRAGFMLIDVAMALAVVLLVAAVMWPAMPRATNSARLSATAMEIATVLRADRTSARRTGNPSATVLDLSSRTVSGGGRSLAVAPGFAFEVLTTAACRQAGNRFRIEFRPDGSSCGAVVRIAAGGRAFRVRVNWLTGWVDVVGPEKA